MSLRQAVIGVVLAALAMTADARPLPRVLERARFLEQADLGGCISGTYPSAVYAAFRWVVAHFTQDELLALLRHRNAVVRAYAVQHFAAQLPAHSESLVPLLADGMTVPELPAELGSGFVIDRFVAERLCKHVAVPAIKQALRAAASRPDVRPPIRHLIRSCSMDPPAADLPLDTSPAGTPLPSATIAPP